jgi:hypothetical protein
VKLTEGSAGFGVSAVPFLMVKVSLPIGFALKVTPALEGTTLHEPATTFVKV